MDFSFSFFPVAGKGFHGMPPLVSGNWAQIYLGIAIFCIYHLLFGLVRGWPAMKDNWKGNVGIGILSVVTGWSLLFGYNLIKTVYDDHEDMAKQIKQLRETNNSQQQQIANQQQQTGPQIQTSVQNALNPIKQENDRLKQEKDKLASELEDRKQSVHTEDPSYRRFVEVFQVLADLKKSLGARRCIIEVSSPVGSSAISSQSILSTFFLADRMLTQPCEIYSAENEDPSNQSSPALQHRIMDGAEDGMVIMHTSKEDGENQFVRNFHDYLSRYIPMKRVYDDNMPKARQKIAMIDHPEPPIIWLQFGNNVHWKSLQ
jgi:hypothetical protein